MLTVINGTLEVRHDVGIIYFHSDQGSIVLTLKGLPKPIPELFKCRSCDGIATVVSIEDSLYCDECKEGHEIDHLVKSYEIEVLKFR